MGGGPSAEERAAQARARAREEADATRSDRLAAAAEKTDPLAERIRSRVMRILDWDEGTGDFAGKPRNVEEMPGLGSSLAVYNQAKQRSAGERMGRGLLSMGTEMQNPELAARIREQQDVEREQEAAGNLENAVRANLAEASGSAMPLAEYSTNRALTLAQLAGGQANSSADRYYQFLARPRQRGFLSQLALNLAGGAGAAGMGMLTGGGSLAAGGLGSSMARGLPGLSRGGVLRRLGEMAWVGEREPELAVKEKEGTRIIPLSDIEARFGLPAYKPQARGQEGAAPVAGHSQDMGLPPSSPAPAGDAARVWPGYNPKPPVFDAAGPLPDVPAVLPVYKPKPETKPETRLDVLQRGRTERADRPFTPNSKLKSVALQAARGALTGGIPGAVWGAAGAAVDDLQDEKFARAQDLGEYDREMGREAAFQKAGLEAEGQRADIGVKKAQTEYYRRRPELEARKIDAQALARQQSALQREIGNRLKEPRPFDPSDPYDVGLLERATGAGVSFSTGIFGDYKTPPTLEVQDPSDPTHVRRTRIQYDRTAGLWKPVAVGGEAVESSRVQPVGDDGLTPQQREALRLSGVRLEETKRHNARMEDIATGRFELSKTNSLGGRAKSAFDVATKGKFEEARRIEGQIRALRTREQMRQISPADRAAQEAELQTQLDAVESEIEAQRTAALSKYGAAEVSTGREDPDVRAYADAHFGGDYQAAARAVQKQRRGKR